MLSTLVFKKFQNPKFHTEIQVEVNGFSQVAWTVGIKHLEGAWLSCDSVGAGTATGREEAWRRLASRSPQLPRPRPPQHQEGKTLERARTLGDLTKTGELAERLYISSRAKQSLVWNFSQTVTFFFNTFKNETLLLLISQNCFVINSLSCLPSPTYYLAHSVLVFSKVSSPLGLPHSLPLSLRAGQAVFIFHSTRAPRVE